MLKQVMCVTLSVRDQDKALDFYINPNGGGYANFTDSDGNRLSLRG